MTRTFLNFPVWKYDNFLSLTQSDVDGMLRASFKLVLKVGLHIEEEEYLRQLEAKGARIDWNRRAVTFSQAQLDEVCSILKKTRPAREHGDPLRCVGGHKPLWVGAGGNMFFDWDAWQARAATGEDVKRVCQWASAYEDVGSFFEPFMPKDVDMRIEPLYTYAIMGRYCSKKIFHAQPTDPIHVKYLDKMARIVERRRGFFQDMQPWEYINPPFRLGGRAIATMLARIDSGICNVIGIGPMTVSGMTGPVTVAGTAVVAVAEMLAGLTAFHIMRPEPGLQVVSCTGELDLATARVKFCGMRTHLQNIAIAEIMRRGIGAECDFMTWYRDANEPGLQACYEFALQQTLFSALKHHCTPEVGGLADGNLFSPEQAVMDVEMIKEFEEQISGFDADDEMIALEESLTAGFEQGYHLSTDHTLRHMRQHVAFSQFFLRGYPAAADHDKSYTQAQRLMDKAHDNCLQNFKKGRELPPDEQLGRELYECVKEAASELGISAPSMV